MQAALYYNNKEQIEDIAIYAVSKKFHNDFLDYHYKISNIVNDTIDLIIKDFENRHFDLLSNPYYIILDDVNIRNEW